MVRRLQVIRDGEFTVALTEVRLVAGRRDDPVRPAERLEVHVQFLPRAQLFSLFPAPRFSCAFAALFHLRAIILRATLSSSSTSSALSRSRVRSTPLSDLGDARAAVVREADQ